MAADLVLAFDFGLKHIGVATGQSVTRTATPLCTLAARAGRPDWKEVVALAKTWRPTCLIVGLPVNMDGSESEMSERARRFATTLGQQTRLPVHLVDERLSSHATRNAGTDNHAAAAALIAESWLGNR